MAEEPKHKMMRPEDLLEKLGGCGRYQVFLATIIHSMQTAICFTMLNLVFSGKSPDWWCVQDVDLALSDSNFSDVTYFNLSHRYKSCVLGNGTHCTKFMFDSGMRTVVTEWDLVCDKAWVPTTMASVQMFGVLAGNFFCGPIADAIGRKKPIFISLAVLFVFNIVSMFSVSWVMFTICRFILGMANGFFVTVHFNLASEFSLAKWRPVIVTIPSWPIQSCLFALVAWLIQDWKYLHLFTALICVPFFPTWWCMQESFRWYIAHDRQKGVERVVKYVAKVNKQPVPECSELHQFTVDDPKTSQKQQKDKKYTTLDLFRSRSLLKITLLLIVDWFALGLVYYGINFGIKNLSGNIYLNIFIFSVVGIPTKMAAMYLQNRLGRRLTSILHFGGTGIFAALAGVLQYIDFGTRDQLTIAAVVISIMLNISAWSTIGTMTIELYPTVVRTIGVGFLNTMARVGAVIGPQIVFLATKVPGLLYFVCGGLSLLCVGSTLILPETKGANLQDKMKETPAAETDDIQ